MQTIPRKPDNIDTPRVPSVEDLLAAYDEDSEAEAARLDEYLDGILGDKEKDNTDEDGDEDEDKEAARLDDSEDEDKTEQENIEVPSSMAEVEVGVA